MQTLRLTKVDNTGKPSDEKIVSVIRSFPDASGQTIYLHSTGIYGYKDGAPIKTVKELSIIGDPRQHALAMRWWRATGQKMSKEYYDAENKRLEKLAGDFQSAPAGGESELDFIMYQSRPAGSKSEKDWSDPFSWMGKYDKRPDWWGQADHIRFKDLDYRQYQEPKAPSGKEI